MNKIGTAEYMYFLMQTTLEKLDGILAEEKKAIDKLNYDSVFSNYPSTLNWEVGR